MVYLITKAECHEGIPLATADDLTLDDCFALTKRYYNDFDELGNYVPMEENVFLQHEDFATTQEYIDYYKLNGYIFVLE